MSVIIQLLSQMVKNGCFTGLDCLCGSADEGISTHTLRSFSIYFLEDKQTYTKSQDEQEQYI